MKGYIPVEIPTKKYIKAYIEHQLGAEPIISRQNHIGSKLYDLLQHRTNERNSYGRRRFDHKVKVYIYYYHFKQRGGFLNENNIRNFNNYVEAHLKNRFYFLMDMFISILPSFENNLPEVRRLLGIDIESWSDDSMKKDYYRYRKAAGIPTLYKKTYTQIVPSEILESSAF